MSDQAKGFFNSILANAVWEGLKQLWTPAVLACVVALWQKFRNGSLDWFAIGGLFVIASVLALLNFRREAPPQRKPDQVLPSENTDWKALYLQANKQKTQFQENYAIAAGRITVLENKIAELGKILEGEEKSLRNRIFDACKELGMMLERHGKRPNEDEIPISDQAEFVRRYNETVQAFDNKFQADYWMNYKDTVVNLRHELALQNLTDEALDQRLNEAQTPSLQPVTVREIDSGLRRLAARL